MERNRAWREANAEADRARREAARAISTNTPKQPRNSGKR